MTNLDQRLRSSLEDLEAAIPSAPLPAGSPSVEYRFGVTQHLGDAPSALSRPSRRRQGLVMLAAVVSLLAITAVVATSAPDPEVQAQQASAAVAEQRFLQQAEVRISDDLGPRFLASCVNLDAGRALVRTRLDELGYADWIIETRDGAENSSCVGSAGSGLRAVYLIPSMGGPILTAMEAIKGESLRQCLSRDQVTTLVHQALARLGAEDWDIALDGRQEVSLQDQSGAPGTDCWTHSRSESHPDGGRTYYVTQRP